jgi:hypothetical protein
MARYAMNETRKPENEAAGQPETPVRRPWHAPQFTVAEFGLTKASVHANTDGNKDGVDGTLS